MLLLLKTKTDNLKASFWKFNVQIFNVKPIEITSTIWIEV